jgi:hypothetical protein
MPTIRLLPALTWLKLTGDGVATRIRTAKNLAIVAAFLGAIGYPLHGFLFLTPQLGETENRALNPFPPPLTNDKWTWQVFPPLFEKYLGDRIGGRADLLALRNSITIDTFGDVPSRSVWTGKDGWLFYNEIEVADGPLTQYRDQSPLLARWAAEFADRSRWCRERGIGYVVVICPDKQSVYPEYLDAVHRRHPPPDPIPTLLAGTAAAGVRVVDLRPILNAAKPECSEPLYYALDTHWNAHGVLVGYRAIAAAVAEVIPGFPVRPVEDFDRTPTVSKPGDIALMAGLPADKYSELAFAYIPGPRQPPVVVRDAAPEVAVARLGATMSGHVPPTEHTGSPAGPSVLLLHDSFGVQPRYLLGPDCRRLLALGSYGLPANLVEAEKPQVVIQLMVERTLWNELLLESFRR